MSKQPTYEELLMQISVLTNRVKYLSEHTERVGEMKKDAEISQQISSMNQEQVNALNNVLESTLNKQEKKSTFKNILFNLFFSFLGAVLGYVLGKILP